MALLIALALALFAGLAKAAKMNGASLVFAIAAFLTFIGWLGTGPGAMILDWLNNPSVDVPSVDFNR